MNAFWWAVLLIAGGILLYIVLKPRLSVDFFIRFTANLVLAAAIVYVIQLTGVLGDTAIVINVPNVLIAGLLGLPGLAMLYAIHMVVFV